MISEEEEEAIELLKDIKESTWCTKYIMLKDSKNAEVLLNLIQKQQEQVKIHVSLEQQYKKEYLDLEEDLKIRNIKLKVEEK